MLYKVKLLTSYLDNPAGSIYETDKEKAEQLVQLKRAEWIKEPKVVKPRAKVMRSYRKSGYKTK